MSKLLGAFLNKAYPMAKYTVVGTPTIVDGVVSGFSSANYLKIIPKLSLGNNFEFFTKFTTGTVDTVKDQVVLSGLTNQYINFGYTHLGLSLQYNVGDGTRWYANTATLSYGKTKLASNTTYYIKLTFDGTTYRSYLSKDKINWVLDWEFKSSLIIPPFTLLYGVGRNYDVSWDGSIDMNETNIKTDGKLWFNGQQA